MILLKTMIHFPHAQYLPFVVRRGTGPIFMSNNEGKNHRHYWFSFPHIQLGNDMWKIKMMFKKKIICGMLSRKCFCTFMWYFVSTMWIQVIAVMCMTSFSQTQQVTKHKMSFTHFWLQLSWRQNVIGKVMKMTR